MARPPQFDSVAGSIQAALLEHTLPSLAVAVAHRGEILWEEGFGWADREAMLPATQHTMYSLASISKPFTATALMLLKERGLIDLDRPVNDYLGAAPLKGRAFDANEATVRRVGGHTAGLPFHFQFFYEDEPYRKPPMEESIRRYGNLISAPGERIHYSNFGYGVLDHVISRVSGLPYADFLRQEVFLPLGMTRSAVGVPPELAPYAAKRYGADNIAYPMYDFDHPGGSAVYASAHDLVRFGLFHLKTHLPDQKQIIPDATIDVMQVRQEAPGEGYGFGWGLDDDELGYRVVEHSGGMGGVLTLLWLVPEEQLAVTILMNSSRHSETLETILGEVVSAILPATGERLAKRAAEAGTATEEPPFAVPPELLGEWRGTVHTYVAALPFALTFKESGDVHARLGERPPALVNSVTFEDGWLRGAFAGQIGTPDADRRRHDLHLDLRLRGDVLNGELVAITNDGHDGGAPGKHIGNALASWTELRKG